MLNKLTLVIIYYIYMYQIMLYISTNTMLHVNYIWKYKAKTTLLERGTRSAESVWSLFLPDQLRRSSYPLCCDNACVERASWRRGSRDQAEEEAQRNTVQEEILGKAVMLLEESSDINFGPILEIILWNKLLDKWGHINSKEHILLQHLMQWT